MKRIAIAAAVVAALAVPIVVLLVARGSAAGVRPPEPPAREAGHAAPGSATGFLYGRVATIDGATHEGRLRFGGSEEAFWSDLFTGKKRNNPWPDRVPADRLPTEDRSIRFLGFTLARRERTVDLGRPFMVRMGDIVRIESRGRDVRVTLKSGTTYDLDRMDASDFDDGVRVTDDVRGVVDVDSLRIRRIEFDPTPADEPAPYRLHGTVTTRTGTFSGFLRWNRRACIGTDTIEGRAEDGRRTLRLDTIRSIEKLPSGGVRVTRTDGRDLRLAGTPDVDRGNRGLYVDDPRYGRLLVSWDAFERAVFDAAGSGPAYDDYPPGAPLVGRVATRTGENLVGRIVFDLDESETVETLDAPAGGVSFSIPFGRIASIVPPSIGEEADGYARVTLIGGEMLRLEPAGDLGATNAGILVFEGSDDRSTYVRWPEVERIVLASEDLPGGPAD